MSIFYRQQPPLQHENSCCIPANFLLLYKHSTLQLQNDGQSVDHPLESRRHGSPYAAGVTSKARFFSRQVCFPTMPVEEEAEHLLQIFISSTQEKAVVNFWDPI
ncbi:hypothetical protein MGYG_06297 [Nannizzia gypsea CBS 118893]|uniref:Uncharacterized protein n=1 Tax=Arthroderma gypseum (strain ATCC MYA-4604 / CBS 118893) TaxID=535722 RepID=E4UYW6_ARTGP|nr:hypothetical protein MGYG_06297 [Nannizzia gypsea CBS 118893]EFR03296.1 hypothetical protein MGYG_06297 [Nannizzia gypsea CBS 118893]